MFLEAIGEKLPTNHDLPLLKVGAIRDLH